MSESKDGRERLLSLLLMRRQIERGDDPAIYLPLARRMISDPDNSCRWQAAIVVGESIETDPDAVWQVVREYGDSQDEDMRTVMARVLLEHLFERDFDRYLTRVREEVSAGRLRFLDTLQSCALFGADSEKREKRVSNYLRKATRGLPNKETRLK